VIVTATAATPVTTPVGETVAAAMLDVDQVATLVTFCVVPSDIVAVAVSCEVVPTAGTDPVTLIDDTVAEGEVVEEHPTANTESPTTITDDVRHRNMRDPFGLAGIALALGRPGATAMPPITCAALMPSQDVPCGL